MNANNKVSLIGEIDSSPVFSHSICGMKFYEIDLKIRRLSDNVDIIPVMLHGNLVSLCARLQGSMVEISGEFRSFDKYENDKNKVILFVFAHLINPIDKLDDTVDKNEIFLFGHVCKKPIYRKTPLRKTITELILAVNRNNGKTDYIPCICWGKNARISSKLEIGSDVKLYGRIQSRIYRKKLSETKYEFRIAYEVSIRNLSSISGDIEQNIPIAL